MKKLFLLGSALALLFIACQEDSKTADNGQSYGNYASPILLAGHWVALDFCSRANQYGSVLGAMNNAHLPFAFAISFDPNKPDSATCNNGIQDMTVPVKFNDDTLELVGASKGKSIFLVYDSKGAKDITMFDGTQGRVQMDKFIKSAANTRDGYTAFTTALNHNLFDGVFVQLGAKAGADPIQFTPGGFILNWGPYDRYSVCTAGNCFIAGSQIDVINLSKSKSEKAEQPFGFRYSAANDTLSIFHLEKGASDSSAYSAKGKAFQFLRKPSGQ